MLESVTDPGKVSHRLGSSKLRQRGKFRLTSGKGKLTSGKGKLSSEKQRRKNVPDMRTRKNLPHAM